MSSPYQPNSCYESDYECICIMINGKTCSVPLNILSSVVGPQRIILFFLGGGGGVGGVGNIKGADQPAHPRSLISAFVIRSLKSIISKLATSEILLF